MRESRGQKDINGGELGAVRIVVTSPRLGTWDGGHQKGPAMMSSSANLDAMYEHCTVESTQSGLRLEGGANESGPMAAAAAAASDQHPDWIQAAVASLDCVCTSILHSMLDCRLHSIKAPR